MKTLLSLKTEYKELVGTEWSPNTLNAVTNTKINVNENVLINKIAEQGDKVNINNALLSIYPHNFNRRLEILKILRQTKQ